MTEAGKRYISTLTSQKTFTSFNSCFWCSRVMYIIFYNFDREGLGAAGVYIVYPDVKMLLLGDL
jgi:hypothetical protein